MRSSEIGKLYDTLHKHSKNRVQEFASYLLESVTIAINLGYTLPIKRSTGGFSNSNFINENSFRELQKECKKLGMLIDKDGKTNRYEDIDTVIVYELL